MKRSVIHKMIFIFLLPTIMSACFLFADRGEQLYKKGRYSICKKNLVSYYLASPDLFVKTEKGEVKINLNPFGFKNKIAQEKISSVDINEITNDSIQIHFISNDTLTHIIHSQIINLNVKGIVDSIQSGK